jgi:hypothetical protein
MLPSLARAQHAQQPPLGCLCHSRLARALTSVNSASPDAARGQPPEAISRRARRFLGGNALIVPAGRKWYRGAVIARIMCSTLEALDLSYPREMLGLDKVRIT